MAQREVSDRELSLVTISAAVALVTGSDFLYQRTLPDGRVVGVVPLMTGHRLGISLDAKQREFLDVWDYPNDPDLCDYDAVWRAAIGWDGEGEPEGWYRHPHTGRRRPDGDSAREHVRW